MDFRQLRYFLAIVEAGSFSGAAGRVHIAQSALSLQVRKLEESLGVRLLVREPQGVRPTAAGRKLVEHARLILDQLSIAEREVRSEQAQPAGPVTIGIPSGVGRVLNAPLLDAVRVEQPRISLLIVEVLPSHVDEWLEAGSIKLAVSYQIEPEDEADVLAREDYFLVSGTIEQELDDSVHVEGLPRFPLVLPTCTHNPEQCVATRASAMGIELDIESRVDSLATILDIVCAKSARSVLTPGAFLPEWRAGKIFAYRIEPAMSRFVTLTRGPTARGDAAAESVDELVRRLAARLVAEGKWPDRIAPSALARAI